MCVTSKGLVTERAGAEVSAEVVLVIWSWVGSSASDGGGDSSTAVKLGGGRRTPTSAIGGISPVVVDSTIVDCFATKVGGVVNSPTTISGISDTGIAINPSTETIISPTGRSVTIPGT